MTRGHESVSAYKSPGFNAITLRCNGIERVWISNQLWRLDNVPNLVHNVVMVAAKKVVARFYATAVGDEPVRGWLKRLSRDDCRIIGTDIMKVEFGWPVGLPVCRSLGNGLWEVRSNISDKRIARIIFGIHGAEIILLHGFIKKTQKTPKRDLDLAARRFAMLRGRAGEQS